MNEPIIEIPQAGDQYIHHSGRYYTVVMVANTESINPDYPVTVVYQGSNGHTWAKTLQRFSETMSKVM